MERTESTLLEAVFDHLPMGAVVLDSEGRIQRFNRYEEQLSGRPRESVIGKSFFDDVAPCTKDIHLGERFFDGVKAGKLDVDLEFSFPYPYNRVARDVRIRAVSVPLGAESAHAILVEDISQRRNVERANVEMSARLRTLLQRYLGDDHARQVESSPDGAVIAHEEEAVVLFADLSGFTNFAAGQAPAELFPKLSARMQDATSAITRYGGVVDKLLGDGVLGYFRMAVHGRRSIYDGLRAARDIIRPSVDQASLALPFRVGLAVGKITIGTVGSTDFGNVTVLGHTVNLSKRLQEAARPGEAIVSPELADSAGSTFIGDPLFGVALKGLPEVQTIFRMTRLDLP